MPHVYMTLLSIDKKKRINTVGIVLLPNANKVMGPEGTPHPFETWATTVYQHVDKQAVSSFFLGVIDNATSIRGMIARMSETSIFRGCITRTHPAGSIIVWIPCRSVDTTYCSPHPRTYYHSRRRTIPSTPSYVLVAVAVVVVVVPDKPES
jgi:hypothetical protein